MKGFPHQPAVPPTKRRRRAPSVDPAPIPVPLTPMEVLRQATFAFGYDCASRALRVTGMDAEQVASFMETHREHVLGGASEVHLHLGLAPAGSGVVVAPDHCDLFRASGGAKVRRVGRRTFTAHHAQEAREAADRAREAADRARDDRADTDDAADGLLSDDGDSDGGREGGTYDKEEEGGGASDADARSCA